MAIIIIWWHLLIPQTDKEIVSFLYHRFGDDRYPSTNISAQAFEDHLQYLEKSELPVVTISDAMQWKNGRVIALTIDDAYKSFYDHGYPLLKKYGFKATLFVNSESVGGADFMSWAQLKEVMEYGIEIGNHTADHAYFLNYQGPDQIEQFKSSLTRGEVALQKQLGVSPRGMAYPYGEFSEAMLEVVRSSGYEYAMAQNSGVIGPGTDKFALPRFPMTGKSVSTSQFSSKVHMRALDVSIAGEQTFSQNPPSLTLTINNDDIIDSSVQCFINGARNNQIITISEDPLELRVNTGKPLQRRRTLYTITAQSKDGNWHWFSKLWVNPQIKE